MKRPCPRRSLLSLSLLLLLAGCTGSGIGFNSRPAPGDDDDDSGSGDDDTSDDDDTDIDDDDDDDDDTGGDFTILSLDPNDGSVAGGYNVDINYSGVINADEAEITVLFGESEAEVLAITGDRILVVAPPGCIADDVDVRVETPSDGADERSFEYQADAVGLDGAVYAVYRTMNFQVAPMVVSGTAEAGFFVPTNSVPLQHLPSVGTCAYNVSAPASNRSYYPVGGSVTMSGGVGFTLSWDAGAQNYGTSSLTSSMMPAPASYSITGATSPSGCAMDLSGVIQAPEPFVVTAPMLDAAYADCWYGFNVGTVVDSLAYVTWDPPHVGTDRVIIQVINAEDPSAWSVTCHAQDTGSFLLEQGDLTGLNAGLHHLIVSRYRLTESSLEPSGATGYGLFVDSRMASIFILATDCDCGYCR